MDLIDSRAMIGEEFEVERHISGWPSVTSIFILTILGYVYNYSVTCAINNTTQ